MENSLLKKDDEYHEKNSEQKSYTSSEEESLLPTVRINEDSIECVASLQVFKRFEQLKVIQSIWL